jgi:hypothetical protein
MQISRHWRMNAQRYRLEGVRYQNGTAHLQPRSIQPVNEQREVAKLPVSVHVSASAAR